EGMSGFVLMADDAVTVERFAAEVAPAVRDLVESERALAPAGGSAAPAAPGTQVPAATPADNSKKRGGLDVTPAPGPEARVSAEERGDDGRGPGGPAAGRGARDPGAGRLSEEHEVIAGLPSRVDAALVALVTDPVRGIPAVRASVDLLTDALLSHLSYEEHQLVEPLARLGPALYG